MALTKENSASIISKFGANDKDTGNTKVQIALLTERIKQLTEHSKRCPKGATAKRALRKDVGQRRRLMRYYQRKDLDAYRQLIKDLGLRK